MGGREAGYPADARRSARGPVSTGPSTWAVAVGVGALVISALFALPFFGDSNRGPTSVTDKAAERTASGAGRFVRPVARMSSGHREDDTSAYRTDGNRQTADAVRTNGWSERKRWDRGIADGEGREADGASAKASQEGLWQDQEVGGRDPEAPDTEKEDEDGKSLPISGWVFDRSGEPVAGIRVVATARHLFHPNADGRPNTGETSQSATTSKDGAFELAGLAEGEYAVQTKPMDKYKAAYTRFRAGAEAAVLVVEDNVEDTIRIHGIVSGDREGPLTDVHVRVPGAKGTALSGEDGRYALTLTIDNRDRSYSARFTKQGYRAESLTIDLANVADGSEIALNAILQSVGGTVAVGGTVTDVAGAPISGASVRFSSTGLQRNYAARSDQFGAFSMAEVEVGNDYRLWVRPKSGYEEYIEEGVVVGANDNDLSVLLEPLDAGTLTGQMVDANGDPVPGFSLWLRAASPSEQQYRLVSGDRTGRFTVDNLPEGEISFSTRSSPYVNVTGVRFSPGDRDSVRLALDQGIHDVTGYVRDINGAPVPGARISLSWSQTVRGMRSRSTRNGVADANGYFLFTQVGPGRHTLNVSAPGHRPARLEHSVGWSAGEIVVRLQKESL